MSKVYTTQELIQILAAERQACLKGERLKLDVSVSGNPILDQFIQAEGLQKFTAYQDFKAAIHDYQRQHQVSGIIWKEVIVKGKCLRYPEVDPQLAALNSDLLILYAAKNSIVEFWRSVTTDMDLYLSFHHGKQFQQIQPEDVERIFMRSEWAGLCVYANTQFLELILQLGWGKPEEACYQRGFPASGSEYIHAVNPGKQPIC
ncbi:hypothetical protein [Calothrix sp. NIES-3974]|uniref:hypothetical protein n=1 Tax=Calothrix sp. NIES-3974 TaxID=2005462 RepID=UPI000B606E59|nr:hypothetical protein [Calothrix sp. NIES-3974]BAZ07027.1 hypothetical protein NIES3974_36890 [Calothrix sp. NIES-3974]